MANQIESLGSVLSHAHDLGGRSAPSQVARERLGSSSDASGGASSSSIREREASTTSTVIRVVSTERVLRDFAKVVENESEKDPRVIARESELESRAASNDQNVAVLQRVMAWVEETTAKAHASPFTRLRCAIRKLPNVLQLHKEPTLPSDRELIDLAQHFYPPRGQLKVEVFDFGDDRAEHSQISLAEVRKRTTSSKPAIIALLTGY